MSIRSATLGAVSLLAAAVFSPALADGMPTRGHIADGSSAAPTPNWSGFYVGAAVGYGIGASELSIPGTVDFDINLKGAQGIVAAGYDFQLSPRWLFGLFADYAFGELEGDITEFAITIDKQWAVGGRLGVLATPSTLLYASAGYTAADFKSIVQPGDNETIVDKAKLDGFFVGLGFEQAFSRNLSLKMDYRFSDFGEIATGGDVNNDFHSVRLGLNYRFGN